MNKRQDRKTLRVLYRERRKIVKRLSRGIRSGTMYNYQKEELKAMMRFLDEGVKELEKRGEHE